MAIYENFCDGPENNGPTTTNSTGPDQFSTAIEDDVGHLYYTAQYVVEGFTSIRAYTEYDWASSYVGLALPPGTPAGTVKAGSLYLRLGSTPPSGQILTFAALGGLMVSVDHDLNVVASPNYNSLALYPGTGGPLALNTWYYVSIETDSASNGSTRIRCYSVPETQLVGAALTFPHSVDGNSYLPGSVGGYMRAGVYNTQSSGLTYVDHIRLANESLPLPGSTLSLSAPPAQAYVDAPAPSKDTLYPPAEAVIETPAPSILISVPTLISPAHNDIVPGLKPIFQVRIPADKLVNGVEVEVSDGTTAVTKAVDVSPGIVSVVPVPLDVQLLPDTTYSWRARVINDWSDGAWTDAWGFSISSLDGDGIVGGTWLVATDTTPAPHLWYVTPERGRVGDSAVAVGTGFGPNLVQVTIAGVQATVTDVSIVDDNADALTDDRVIDADSDTSSPRHQRVTFTIPDVPQPGGPLYVEGM